MVHMNSTSSMYFIHLTANLSLDHLLSGKYPIGLHDVVLASFFFLSGLSFFFSFQSTEEGYGHFDAGEIHNTIRTSSGSLVVVIIGQTAPFFSSSVYDDVLYPLHRLSARCFQLYI